MGKRTFAAASFSSFCFFSKLSIESGWPLVEAMVCLNQVCVASSLNFADLGCEESRTRITGCSDIRRLRVDPFAGMPLADQVYKLYWRFPCYWTAYTLFGPGHSFFNTLSLSTPPTHIYLHAVANGPITFTHQQEKPDCRRPLSFPVPPSRNTRARGQAGTKKFQGSRCPAFG